MAVVFISPKQRQKVFFMGITILLLLFLTAVFAFVFFSKPKEVSPILVFNKPKVSINLSIFDSDEFIKLEPFSEMEMQYEYKATDKDKKQEEGFISAVSLEEAKNLLTSMDLTVLELKLAEIGRGNPFEPYYQPAPIPIIPPK
ncbi:MAG: hypothetical protein NT026_02195 [Candidatus Staskawiczbacteria bacterium]|nr:hypothetical protein [Candidatus Staskawiczbacteria bacterium]